MVPMTLFMSRGISSWRIKNPPHTASVSSIWRVSGSPTWETIGARITVLADPMIALTIGANDRPEQSPAKQGQGQGLPGLRVTNAPYSQVVSR